MTSSTEIQGLLIDLDGVLYVGESPVPGAREIVDRLETDGIPHRFVTNTTTKTVEAVVKRLTNLGFTVDPDQVFSPITATLQFLQDQGSPSVNPVVRDSVLPAFSGFPRDEKQPEYVVIGDIGAAWSYPLINTLFAQLHGGAQLIAMHRNKYFQGDEGLMVDIGAFVAGLEYVSGTEAKIIGKPNPAFFELALQSMDLQAEDVAMIGDDIDTDVGGAQASGLKGFLVKTGKYRDGCIEESDTTPDGVVDSIADLFSVVNFIQQEVE